MSLQTKGYIAAIVKEFVNLDTQTQFKLNF